MEKEKRKIRAYKIKDSVYSLAMEKCKGGKPLSQRIEKFVTRISKIK